MRQGEQAPEIPHAVSDLTILESNGVFPIDPVAEFLVGDQIEAYLGDSAPPGGDEIGELIFAARVLECRTPVGFQRIVDECQQLVERRPHLTLGQGDHVRLLDELRDNQSQCQRLVLFGRTVHRIAAIAVHTDPDIVRRLIVDIHGVIELACVDEVIRHHTEEDALLVLARFRFRANVLEQFLRVLPQFGVIGH